MPSYHGGKILIFNPSGASLEVSISTPVGVYDQFTCDGEPVSFPATITADAQYDTEYDGEYTLSIKQGDTECATYLGTEAVVPLHFGSQFSCTPGVKAEPAAPPTFEEPAPAPAPEPVAAPVVAPGTPLTVDGEGHFHTPDGALYSGPVAEGTPENGETPV